VVALLAPFISAAPNVWWNGLNIPWNDFGYDIGTSSYNQGWFQTFFQTCQQNHVNSARFWLHCDGRASPNFDSNGYVTGLSSTFLPQLTSFLSLARQYNVVILLTLWSFDMFKQEVPNGLHADLVSDMAKTRSYIQYALIPILAAARGYDNLAIEVINEPEWAIQGPGNTKVQVPLNQMQRFTAMLAEAVHQNSAFKVTTGSASLKWDSAQDPPAAGNWWNDTQLYSAYPSATGHLDFFQIHYYDWMHNNEYGFDPCRENAGYWLLRKPTLVGELPANGGSFYTPIQFMNCTFANNFVGNAFWAYNANWPWTDAQSALNQFYAANPSVASYNALVNWLKGL